MSDRLWPLYAENELSELPEPKWLVDGHLTDGFTVLYGPPKQGKTFLALSWALSIGSGHRWHGNNVTRGPVLYVSGEGTGGLHRRTAAWKAAEGTHASQLYVVPFGVRLVDREHVIQLRADLHSTGAKLLVVDTLARSMAGADENSAQDMGVAIQALDWLREKTGCAVLVLHHSGVSGERPRGSTALFGAADTLIRVDGDGRFVNVRCEGQKDSAPFRPLSFELVRAVDSVSLARREVRTQGYSFAASV
jgi:RecA-family ATPase